MAHQALALELAPTLLKKALQKYWPQIVAEADKSSKDLALALEHTPMWKKIKAREGPDALMAARVFLSQQFDEMPTSLKTLELFLMTSDERSLNPSNNINAILRERCAEVEGLNHTLFEALR